MDKEHILCTSAINKFSEDFKNLSKKEMVDKYLRDGRPFIFDEDEVFFKLKKEIASFFNIDHTNVYMVGSCKLGFSINPEKLWAHVNDDSDIDIAIINENLFDALWKNLFDLNINTDLTPQMKRDDRSFHLFLDYFFRGWLRPDIFPFGSPKQKEIFEFTKTLYGAYQRKISIGIFKNEYFFTRYHEENLNKIIIKK